MSDIAISRLTRTPMLWSKAKSSPDRCARKKLDLDFVSRFRRHGAMADEYPPDANKNELVIQLCTRIGMMMEDLSPLALDVSPVGLEARGAQITQGISAMATLAHAAQALID